MEIKGESTKKSLREFSFKPLLMRKKITHSKTFMIKSKQLAIIQAFKVLCKIKIDKMVVILKFVKDEEKR